MLTILLIIQNNLSMDHSNHSSKKKYPKKRGRCKEVELHNTLVFLPHKIVLQFTPTWGKRVDIHASLKYQQFMLLPLQIIQSKV